MVDLRRLLILGLLCLSVPMLSAADLTQTPVNVALSGNAGSVTVVQAGESVSQGMPVYRLASDGKHYQTDADDTAAKAVVVGIVMTPASADGYFLLARNNSILNLGGTLVVGTTYVISATKGAIAPIGDLGSGDYTSILGTATAADTLPLNIYVSGVAKP